MGGASYSIATEDLWHIVCAHFRVLKHGIEQELLCRSKIKKNNSKLKSQPAR